MSVVFPRPLRPGDRIGVTSPSSGVDEPLLPRLRAGIEALRGRGYDVVVGDCMDGTGPTSAPKEQRAAELTAMLADPAIAAVVPPWGGVLAIDILDQLDWDALAAAEPTWLVGFSDTTHGAAAADAPARLGDPARHQPDGHAVPPARRTPALDRRRRRQPRRSPSAAPGGTAPTGWDDYAARSRRQPHDAARRRPLVQVLSGGGRAAST